MPEPVEDRANGPPASLCCNGAPQVPGCSGTDAATVLEIIGLNAGPAVLLVIDAVNDSASEVREWASFAQIQIGEKAATLAVPVYRYHQSSEARSR